MKRTFSPLAFLALALGLGLGLALTACGGEPAPAPVPPPTIAPSPPVATAPAPPVVTPALPYPAARRTDQVDEIHGVRVADPYRWLEDGKSDEVKQWVAAEDGLARSYLAKLPGRDAMAARMKELFYVESEGTPRKYGGRLFYPRRDAGREKAAVYWRDAREARAAHVANAGPAGHEAHDATEKVLLDPNQWSSDGSSSLGVWSVSWDGRKVAYSVKANNSDESTLHVMDVATGKKSDVDVIEGTRYAQPAWTPSGDGFYYNWIPPKDSVPTADRPGYQEIRFHKLGTDPTKDRVVHERTGDPRTFLESSVSRNGRWLVVTTQHGWTRVDVQFMDLRAPASSKPAWQPLAVGQDAIYDVDFDGDRFFVRTNEGAPRWRVFRVDPMHAERAKWTEVVPERKDATLEGAGVVGHRLGLVYLKDVVSQAEIHDEDGKLERTLTLPTIGAMGGWSGQADDDVAFYSFQSFTYPTEIFETNVKTGKTTTFYKLKVPVDETKYTVEQLFTASKDGTRIPYFVVHAKDAVRNGKNPTILTGYGGFQSPTLPYFATSIYPWLEQGGVWAVANIRGGSEYGEEWHRHGMRHEKQNVFDDFYAVAEDLAKQQFTSPAKLALLGGSNGGLLVGAAITQRPDLFRVALCAVPLLDMVRYHLFGSGKTWIEEYGSADDAEDFKALYAYSPYHHVTPGTRYPATLVLSADSDDRVDPMHARKFAAELQAASSDGPVLLRVEKHSGHGGADMVKSNVERIADEYAFALDQMR